MEDKIFGRNPVLEAIKNGREIDKIMVKKGGVEGSLNEIIRKAKGNGIVVTEVEKQKLDAFDLNKELKTALTILTETEPIDEKWTTELNKLKASSLRLNPSQDECKYLTRLFSYFIWHYIHFPFLKLVFLYFITIYSIIQ